jgi:hypothetical protein
MTLPSHLSPTILSASISHIAPLFMAAAKVEEQAARAAVTDLLADYKPQTNEELTLAADIVHYRFLAMDNLARSSDPELSLTKVLRLRGSAVSLSREAHKAQRKLDKLQASRTTLIPEAGLAETILPKAGIPETAPQPEPAPPAAAATGQPPPTPAELAALHVARDLLSGKKPSKPSKYGGGLNYAQQLSKRAMVQTMKENAARIAAEAARQKAETATVQAA